MRTAPLVFCVALLGLVMSDADAQTGGLGDNRRSQLLSAADTLYFGGEVVLPRTLRATDRRTGDTLEVEVGPNWAFAKTRPPRPGPDSTAAATDSVRYAYRVLASPLSTPIARLDSLRLLNQRAMGFPDDPAERGVSLAELRRDLGAVDYRGSFGRGLRFGNSQNLVLDSKLDLQLNGDLGDGLTVTAAVSDQNIPLQPEGNTVQLQEFDKIFVTVARERHRLTAGDYNLRSTDGHFLKFDKALQGLTYRNGAPEGATVTGDTARRLDYEVQASAASSRGDFRRIQLPVADGNQGPYRLTGARGEPFVIVLAGTERVYLDGRLLVRGIDRDYVIDYNRGEISFTPRLLVNRFQRILVEYEYVDREYLRTLLHTEARVTQGDWLLYAQAFRQQDGLRRTGSELSPAAEAVLRASPGSRDGVLVPSATPFADESANPIRYEAVAIADGACGVDSFFRFAPQLDVAEAVDVSFTEVGPGVGEYRLASEVAVNGLVFEYVGRDSACVPLGNYAPLRSVQTPRSLTLVTFGGRYAPDESLAVTWEVVGNQQDLNRFSPGADNTVAGFGSLSKTWRLGKGTLLGRASAEGTGDGFEVVAPWRSAEFNRAWNLGQLAALPSQAPGSEALYSGGVTYALGRSDVGYGVDRYTQEGQYEGLRQNWRAGISLADWRLTYLGDALQASRDGESTGRGYQQLGAARAGEHWEQAFALSTLRTSNYDAVRDATVDVDRRVTEWSGLTRRVATDSTYGLSLRYSGRADERLGDGDDDPRAAEGLNHEVQLGVQSASGGSNQLELTATYRRTDDAATAGPEPNRNFYAGRLTHTYRTPAAAWLRAQTSLEAGSGQERRIVIQYIRTQPGLGQYVWRDYDNDGVEDLGEFELAVFADSATYIRAVGLTDEFVATNTLAANQSINVDPSRVRGGPQKAFWRRLSYLNTVNLKRRALQSSGYARLFAVDVGEADTTIVGDNLAWRSALYLNRARNTFRAELEHRQLANRAISVQGLQSLRTTGQRLRCEQPLGDSWRIEAEADRELRTSRAEGLSGRNFRIDTRRAGGGLAWRGGTVGEVSLRGDYRTGRDQTGASEVTARELTLEATLRLPRAAPGATRSSVFAGANLRADLKQVAQRFEGDADSAVGFALLEGLRPGRSWVWSANVDKQLGRARQLSLRYDGRQLGGGRTVHTGQAQVQAVF